MKYIYIPMPSGFKDWRLFYKTVLGIDVYVGLCPFTTLSLVHFVNGFNCHSFETYPVVLEDTQALEYLIKKYCKND